MIASAVSALVLSLAGVAGGVGAAGVAADARVPDLYVLADGANSVSRTSHPLFDGAILVPRGRAHDRFAVQNGSQGVAYLRIALTSVQVPDSALRNALSLSASTDRGSGPEVPLATGGSCVPLVAPQAVAPGATVDVDTALVLGDLTGTAGQSSPIGFSLLVVLDADPTGSGCDTGGQGGGGPGGEGTAPPERERPAASPLAATGSDLLATGAFAATLGGLGLAAVLAGSLASRARAVGLRRRRATDRGPRAGG